MRRKTALRMISAAMLCAALAFAVCAAIYPEFGITIYMGLYRFELDRLRGSGLFHAAYAAVMAALFAASFFAKDGSSAE